MDALAAAVELLDALAAMPRESRAAVEEKLRVGRPPDDPERNARIVEAYDQAAVPAAPRSAAGTSPQPSPPVAGGKAP